MSAYYNENDKFAAAWLRNLIDAGVIAAGDVDERSILDVRPDDLAGYSQCHCFAGIGGWSFALRIAGVEDDAKVWTGSCPCQPLSSAGQHKGHVDERHLWPAFHDLIAVGRPAVVFGEQVASKDGREWLAGVRADLEVLGYAVGGADLCSASVGAPNIRQRLFWVADADGGDASAERLQRGRQHRQQSQDCGIGRLADATERGQRSLGGADIARDGGHINGGRALSRLADPDGSGLRGDECGQGSHGQPPSGDDADGRRQTDGLVDAEGVGRPRRTNDEDGRRREQSSRHSSPTDGMGNASRGGLRGDAGTVSGKKAEGGREWFEDGGVSHELVTAGASDRLGVAEQQGLEGHPGNGDPRRQPGRFREGTLGSIAAAGPLGFWSRYAVVHCTDGSARRFEPESFPLASGLSGRVGQLRAYGNAINPWVAAEFVATFMECKP